jgi:hypothetical protein
VLLDIVVQVVEMLFGIDDLVILFLGFYFIVQHIVISNLVLIIIIDLYPLLAV